MFSNSSGLADGRHKWKRSNETRVKKAQKGRHKTKKGSDAKKKPNKCRTATLRSDAEASATDSTSDDSDSGVGTQDEDSGEDDDTSEDNDNDNNEEVVPQTMTGKSTRNTSMDPRLWKGPVAPVNAVVDTTALASPSNASVLPSLLTTHSVPSLPVNPLIILPPPPSTVSGSVLATNPPPSPSSDKSPPSVIDAQDNSWPAWFTDAHRLLSSQNLGQEYTSLILINLRSLRSALPSHQVDAQRDLCRTTDPQRSIIGFLKDARCNPRYQTSPISETIGGGGGRVCNQRGGTYLRWTACSIELIAQARRVTTIGRQSTKMAAMHSSLFWPLFCGGVQNLRSHQLKIRAGWPLLKMWGGCSTGSWVSSKFILRNYHPLIILSFL